MSEGWAELERLEFREDGGIDWSRRPFAKRWSMRRLGKAGLLALIAEHVASSANCFHLTAVGDPVEVELAAGVGVAWDDPEPRHHWLVHPGGRWLIELSADRTFTFEFTSARNTRMLKRLKALEAEWSGLAPGESPPSTRPGLTLDVARSLQRLFQGRATEG